MTTMYEQNYISPRPFMASAKYSSSFINVELGSGIHELKTFAKSVSVYKPATIQTIS